MCSILFFQERKGKAYIKNVGNSVTSTYLEIVEDHKIGNYLDVRVATIYLNMSNF